MRVLVLILALLPTPTLAGEVLAARTLRAGTVLVPEDLRLAAGTASIALVGQEDAVDADQADASALLAVAQRVSDPVPVEPR